LKRLPASIVGAGNVERLGCWIDVMKGQGAQESRISAEGAFPALVLDHAAFERDTIDAIVAPARVADKLRVPCSIVIGVDARAERALTDQL
jgi:hypothetical protein